MILVKFCDLLLELTMTHFKISAFVRTAPEHFSPISAMALGALHTATLVLQAQGCFCTLPLWHMAISASFILGDSDFPNDVNTPAA